MKNRLKGIFQTFLGAIFIELTAQLTFDFSVSAVSIPITGQTLGVILVAYLCDKYFGILAVLLYLIFGGLGLPVFADGASGWEKFSSGSGGFLIGFLFAALLIYFLKFYWNQKKIGVIITLNFLATAVILIFGIAWLTNLYGFSKALEYGLFPFWIGALIKIGFGTLVITLFQQIKIEIEKQSL